MRVWPADTRKRMHYRIIAGAGNRIHGVRLPYIHKYIHTYIHTYTSEMLSSRAKVCRERVRPGLLQRRGKIAHTYIRYSHTYIHTYIHKYECLLKNTHND